MKRNLKVYLDDILESSAIISEYLNKVNFEKFSKDIGIQDKILRRLLVIGEIARLLPENFKEKHLNIPWERIAGMRNVIIHEYFGVEMKRIWKVAKHDLPKFQKEIKKISTEIK